MITVAPSIPRSISDVLAATQDAKSKVDETAQEKMKDMAGGLPIPPGLKLW